MSPTIAANGVTLGVDHFGDAAAPPTLLAGGPTMLGIERINEGRLGPISRSNPKSLEGAALVGPASLFCITRDICTAM